METKAGTAKVAPLPEVRIEPVLRSVMAVEQGDAIFQDWVDAARSECADLGPSVRVQYDRDGNAREVAQDDGFQQRVQRLLRPINFERLTPFDFQSLRMSNASNRPIKVTIGDGPSRDCDVGYSQFAHYMAVILVPRDKSTQHVFFYERAGDDSWERLELEATFSNLEEIDAVLRSLERKLDPPED